MKNSVLITFLSFIFIFSCSEPELGEEPNLDLNNMSLKSSSNDYYDLKKKFAKALHKAMKEHQEVRQFIKDEALKKFNGDYDVLYNYVSDSRVAGSTFRDIIASYYENESDLTELENAVPSLTIFVPKLPEDSFSAENWNVAEEVPLVAVKFTNRDKVPLFSSDADSYLIHENAIPGFPVVVLKPNERIISNANPQYNDYSSREYSSSNGYSFKFLHSFFNFINPIIIDVVIDDTPNYLVDAWNVYGQGQNLGWHRDFIYYTLQPSNINGSYINDYSEFMRWFKLEGTGLQALENIAETPATGVSGLDDPELDPVVLYNNNNNFNQGSFWTDGAFEFDVNVVYDKDQPQLRKGFSANPEDLFDIEYGMVNFGVFIFYYAQSIETKPYKLDLEIQPWQLHNYSNEWFFEFQEVDTNQEITNQESYTTKYNTNFGFESGELFKFGLELGGSMEVTESDTKTRKIKLESNDLGTTTSRFGDNMIISEHNH